MSKPSSSVFLAALILAGTAEVRAQTPYEPYAFATLAGLPPGRIDGQGSAARFQRPESVAMDSAGNAYVADSGNNAIRKVTPSGQVTTFAGKLGVHGYVDGQGDAVRFSYPIGIVSDADGNFWVADAGNDAIRKITPSGVVSTFVGGTVGTGEELPFYFLRAIAIDNTGTIFVTDNETVRRVAPAGTVTTLAGSPGISGFQIGPGPQARFNGAAGIVVDNNSALIYVADTNNEIIRFVTPAGLAGIFSDIEYTGEETEDSATYYLPTGLAIDAARNVYVTDVGYGTVRRIEFGTGNVHTIAGSALAHSGSTDATGTAARFAGPVALAFDGTGNIYVADATNANIRKIDQALAVTTIAGLASRGTEDGAGAQARFAAPNGVAVDNAGNVYVADTDNYTIRKVSHTGVVSTLAGSPGVYGSDDGHSGAARFTVPKGVAVDGAGNVYVADTNNNSIRKISPTGDVTTVAVMPDYDLPEAVAVGPGGNLFVAATASSAILKVTLDGQVSVFAGQRFSTGSLDGNGNFARFKRPSGIAADNAGNLYVADTYNRLIRKITPDANVSTIPIWLPFYPKGIAADGSGNLFLATWFSGTIGKLTLDGQLTIVGGSETEREFADGIGSESHFVSPVGIAVDADENVYVGDTGNNVIRVGRAAPLAPTLTRLPNRNFLLSGKTGPNAVVDITVGAAINGTFLPLTTVTADSLGAYHYEDQNRSSLSRRFYRASLHLP